MLLFTFIYYPKLNLNNNYKSAEFVWLYIELSISII